MSSNRLTRNETGSSASSIDLQTTYLGHAGVSRLPKLAQELVASYYSKEAEPLLELMTDNCVFIVESGTMYCGKDQLRAALEERGSYPAMLVRETDFRLVSAVEGNRTGLNAVVAGSYKLYTSPREQLLYSSTQLLTVCFTLTEEGWKAFHLHSSIKASESVDDEVFPLKTSRETYEYVREILRTGSKAGILPSRVLLEGNTETRYTNPDEILYVEAEGKHSVVHCLEGEFTVNKMISDVEAQVPGTFLRVHRSFLVNTAHISGMRRFVLELSDGTEIPVPERRYGEVRREIALRAAGGRRI